MSPELQEYYKNNAEAFHVEIRRFLLILLSIYEIQ